MRYLGLLNIGDDLFHFAFELALIPITCLSNRGDRDEFQLVRTVHWVVKRCILLKQVGVDVADAGDRVGGW